MRAQPSLLSWQYLKSLSSWFKSLPPSIVSETWRLYTQCRAVYLYKLCLQLTCDFVQLWTIYGALDVISNSFTRHFRRLETLASCWFVNNQENSTWYNKTHSISQLGSPVTEGVWGNPSKVDRNSLQNLQDRNILSGIRKRGNCIKREAVGIQFYSSFMYGRDFFQSKSEESDETDAIFSHIIPIDQENFRREGTRK
jgi:hypothetical protein